MQYEYIKNHIRLIHLNLYHQVFSSGQNVDILLKKMNNITVDVKLVKKTI